MRTRRAGYPRRRAESGAGGSRGTPEPARGARALPGPRRSVSAPPRSLLRGCLSRALSWLTCSLAECVAQGERIAPTGADGVANRSEGRGRGLNFRAVVEPLRRRKRRGQGLEMRGGEGIGKASGPGRSWLAPDFFRGAGGSIPTVESDVSGGLGDEGGASQPAGDSGLHRGGETAREGQRAGQGSAGVSDAGDLRPARRRRQTANPRPVPPISKPTTPGSGMLGACGARETLLEKGMPTGLSSR